MRLSLRRLFGSRKMYGERKEKTEKLFYYYEDACRFLAACRAEDADIPIFSAVELDTWFSGMMEPWGNLRLAGERGASGRVIFPLFRLDDVAPIPVALAIRDPRHIWIPIETCERLPVDPKRQWVVPVFSGQAWTEGKRDEERSYNPLIICAAGGIPVYQPDQFVSPAAYQDTLARSDDPAIVPVVKSAPTFHSLDRIAECVPVAVDGDMDEGAAADAIWKLFGRMRRANITPERILDRLSQRYLNEVYNQPANER
ncbi:MAG: hypothetical protein ABIZ04_21150 [Opitutus sp.]